MTFTVRKLPCSVGKVIDESTLPQGTVLFNPSVASPILYLRGMTMSSVTNANFVVLHNMLNKTTLEINDKTQLLPTANVYTGLEDLRIAWFAKDGVKRLWFTATCSHASHEMNNELVVGYFSDSLKDIERMSVVDMGFPPPIKNICPFVHDGVLKLLDVTTKSIFILEDSEKGFEVSNVATMRPMAGIKWLNNFRGSTSPVHLHGNLWGCVIHDIIYNSVECGQKLSYIHHWIEFDVITGDITFLSSPFWIAHWGIEFVSGILLNYEDDSVRLYVGVNDSRCVVAKTTLYDLRVGK